MVITPAHSLKNTGRNRIEFACAQDLLDCFLKASFHQQVKCVPVMARGVVRIDLDRTAVLAFCYGPVEVVTNGCEAECAVSLRGTRIEFHCFCRGLFRSRGSFGERPDTEDTKPVVVVGDACVG